MQLGIHAKLKNCEKGNFFGWEQGADMIYVPHDKIPHEQKVFETTGKNMHTHIGLPLGSIFDQY